MLNRAVAGSILIVFPKKANKTIFSRLRTCKTQPLTSDDESNISHSDTEKVALDTGYLVEVPGLLWR